MIRSKPFGPTLLAGKDAIAFKEALQRPVNDAAVRLIALGAELCREPVSHSAGSRVVKKVAGNKVGR